ncbi:MAG: radical SAM protein [Candidatus Aenigmatarchaeota archaeon]
MLEYYLIRPDCVHALEDQLVKKILPRYIKVVKNELPSRFQIAKRIVFEFDESLSEEELWKEHEKLMEKFYEIKEVIDKGKLKIEDLEVPRFSLLDLKIILTKDILKSCELCERKCHANRLEDGLGFCKVGNQCLISSEQVHLGEESFYTPSHTIFFWSCNMQCVFCQNYTMSFRLEPGIPVTPEFLAKKIEKRRKKGCRNVNFVGSEPTPFLLWILEALKYCKVNVPTLWNSNMFMSEKTMQILDGIVDVYLTDFKFGPGKCSEYLTKVKNYWNVVTRNHLIAVKQTEVTVRHLILPNHIECCSFPIIRWIAKNIKDKCLLNLMDQYFPYYLAEYYPEINRRITEEEYHRVLDEAGKLELNIKD